MNVSASRVHHSRTHALHKAKVSVRWIPALYATGAIVAGLTFPEIEVRIFPGLVSRVTVGQATAIYSAIGSGMIALTGIVFSIAFVMIQFSASTYTPRLVVWIARNPLISHALGVFTATFLYALTALAWIDRNHSGNVPAISLVVVGILLLASVDMFIRLIHLVSLLQVNQMLIFTADKGREAIVMNYPDVESEVAAKGPGDLSGSACSQIVIYSGRPRSVQAVDVSTLLQLAVASGGVIEMAVAVGDTVIEMMPVVRVYGSREPIEEKKLWAGIEVGDERTFEQDPKYAIRLLVDIAIRALSPAINDPTTAVQALDQIEDLLTRLGQRHLEIGAYRDDAGQLRLVVPFPTWEDLIRLAFDEICFCGASSVQVMRRMNALIADLISRMPEKRHPALRHWQARVSATIARSFVTDEEKRDASEADRQGLGVQRQGQSRLHTDVGSFVSDSRCGTK